MRRFSFACLVLCLAAPSLLSQSVAPVAPNSGEPPVLQTGAIHSQRELMGPVPASGGLQKLPGHVPWIRRELAARPAPGKIYDENLLSSLGRESADQIFLTALTFNSGGNNPSSMAVRDVNGDGIPDLVVANECGTGSCTTGVVEVFLGEGDGTFKSPVSFGSGGLGPSAVVIADVNGDGKFDLVVTNECADSSCTNGAVSVLLGNGNGSFNTAVSYNSGGLRASSVAVGDLNGDGKLDLAVANGCDLSDECASGGVGILLGDGKGNFSLSGVYGSGGQFASSVALGDLNRDGKLDLVVASGCSSNANCTVGTVGVLLNEGNGTFRAAVTYNTGEQQADSVALTDVNRDGNLDLIVGNECSNQNCTTGTVSVLLGKGNGTFQTAVNYGSGGTGAVSVTTADLKGDRKSDLVVTNECDSDADCLNGTVSVLAGKGDGTFQAAVSYSSNALYPNSVAVADVNGDGRPDLLVGSSCYDNGCAVGAVGLLLGKDDGTFRAALNYGSGGQDANSIAAADLNRNGKIDLVVVSECLNEPDCPSGAVSVLLGNGHGNFANAVTYGSGGSDPHSVAVADVNGDGKPDLVVANVFGISAETGGIGVLLGNGNGTFRPAMSLDSGAVNAVSVKIADVNRDGIPDLVVANECNLTDCTSGVVSVLLGNGNGTFRPAVNYGSGGQYASSVAVADVNRDGKPDLIVSNWCASGGDCTNGTVSVLLGIGNGTFKPAVTYGSGGQFSSPVVVVDLNRDGKLDLVVANEDSISVLLGNGNGTFETAATTATPTELDSGDGSLAVMDFNGDGRLDVAAGAAGVLLLGNGDGTFQLPLPLGAAGRGLVAGDLNRNGKPFLANTGVTVLQDTF